MSKNKKLALSKAGGLIPKLRFPEFVKDGEWVETTLNKVVLDFIVPMRDKPKKLDGKIPWCRIEDFNGMYLSRSKSNQGVSPDTVNEMNLKVYPIGTLLVSCSADLGRCAITEIELITNQTFIGLVPDTNKVDTVYLYFTMINSRNELNARSSGTTISYLSRKEFEKFGISLPRPKEQQKIASCLSSLDEIIEARNQRLELLKNHKKGLMQNLFPQEGEKVPEFRFPEFKNDGKWVEEKLESLTDKIGDGIHTTPKYDPMGEYYFINGNNLIDGKILVDEKTKRVTFSEFELHKKDLTKRTILLSINGTIGNVAFYSNEKVVLGKSACYIIPSKRLNNIFLYYTLQSPKISSYFTSELTGSTIKNLSLKSIRETKIMLPSEKEQQKIASCLSVLDELITAEADKIEQLKQHKKGLMQGLFPREINSITNYESDNYDSDHRNS